MYPNAHVDAVDIDPKLVELVQQRAKVSALRNVDVRQGNIEESSGSSVLQFLGSSVRAPRGYGIIYSVDVFEHLKDPGRALTNLAGMLAPGGTLLIHVPRATQRRFFRRFEHYDQHDHEREGFEPEELTRLMRDAGLSVAHIRHTFGPPGALAWELFHLTSGIGKWLALLTYPIPWLLAWVDGWFRWGRGNGMLLVARR
jgi:2-polyprenyl-3-methyl-5-hydroxy-6-metoxy-1,4-benzoquinol methylase